jgi:hypothetical protein
MHSPLIITIILTLSAIVFVLLAIRRWPLKFVRRRLLCPVQNATADVKFTRSEVSFGSLVITDIQTCSLFREQPLTCDRSCLPSR